jgi:Radical SAM superfamily/B12 binding domain
MSSNMSLPVGKSSLRVLFVNALLGGDFSSLDIGITVLATWVERKTRHSAAIADLTFHSRHWQRHLHHEIERKRPDVIAISCNTMYMQYVRRVVAEICKEHQIPIVLGGHHATIAPDEVFRIPGVHAVVIGDGEEPLTEYLDRLATGRPFEGVAGLWAREADGTESRNDGGGFLRDIDQLPWLDWDLWDDLDRYFYFLGMMYAQGSRGCPYRCTFCDAQGYKEALGKGGKYFRLRDPKAFVRELEHYWEKYRHRGLRLFQVFDPVFTMDDAWVEAFCEAYRASGLHEQIRYSVFSRIDHLSEDKVRNLARSGCALLRVGVEAGDDHIRANVYRKKIDTDTIRRIVRIAKEGGIDFTAFYILGGPQETRGTFRKTIELAWELDAARSAFFVYKPFTHVGRAQLREGGGGVDEARWSKADNISFGGTTYGRDWGPRTLETYQFVAYGLTFGRRWVRTVRRRGPRYVTDLASYLSRGVWHGLDLRYLGMYFHIYEGDNIDR